MDRLGHELLAGAALAGDEHDGVGRRDAHDAPEHLAHALRAADDVLELVPVLELAREKGDLAGEPPIVERLCDLHEKLLLGERLLDVVERAEAHRLDGALDGAVRGHHDDLGHRLGIFRRAKDVDAVFRPHAQIGEHDVVGAGRASLCPLLAVGRFVDFVTRTPQHHRERRAHVALVVDDEDLRHQLFGAPCWIHWLICAMTGWENVYVGMSTDAAPGAYCSDGAPVTPSL